MKGQGSVPIPSRAVILFSPATNSSSEDQLDSEVQMMEVKEELLSLGMDATTIPLTLNLAEALQQIDSIQPDLVFNLVEDVHGHGRLVHLAQSLLDVTRIPYTGAGANATFFTVNKVLAKDRLLAAGIPTPALFSLNDLKHSAPPIAGRFIIKSVWEHASIGLGQDSIVDVTSASQLFEKMTALQPRLSGECFAEAYIDGREFNLSILAGPEGPHVLSPAEIIFQNYPPNKFKIVDYAAKWKPASYEYSHTPRSFEFAESDATLLEQVKSIALACWHLFDLRGYARVDFRVDADGNPFVLEINTNPCISKDAGFIAACERSQITYREVILRILADTNH